MITKKSMLLLRTVRHLRLAQVAHRLRLRAQGAVEFALPSNFEKALAYGVPAAVGWPTTFSAIDASLQLTSGADLVAGRINLLAATRELSLDWIHADAPRLWRFHLHYWDWAWVLVGARDGPEARSAYQELWISWHNACPLRRGDAWATYVVALRAWSWCGQYETLVKGSHFDGEFRRSLWVHARFLQTHLELDIGGNHVIKDLKALVGLGVFFGKKGMVATAVRRLENEISKQILRDGGHYERSPAYHCQVLGDLIDLERLLSDACPDWLHETVCRMQSMLGLILLPDGTVPMLNDGYPVAPGFLRELGVSQAGLDGLTVLPDTGLIVMRRRGAFVLVDVGLPCPADLPGHAHADTLGFLFYYGTTPVVSECGTSTYEAGALRDYERGTAAHSTVQIDREDSTEVWGAFRAARRARPRLMRVEDSGDTQVVAASHDGYRRLFGKPIHTRTISLGKEGLLIEDTVEGRGVHDIAVRFHGTPTDAVHFASESLLPLTRCRATGWGQVIDTPTLEFSGRATLPWHFSVELRPSGWIVQPSQLDHSK